MSAANLSLSGFRDCMPPLPAPQAYALSGVQRGLLSRRPLLAVGWQGLAAGPISLGYGRLHGPPHPRLHDPRHRADLAEGLCLLPSRSSRSSPIGEPGLSRSPVTPRAVAVTCQVSGLGTTFLGLFWMYNSNSRFVDFPLQLENARAMSWNRPIRMALFSTSPTATFAQSATPINCWLVIFLLGPGPLR